MLLICSVNLYLGSCDSILFFDCRNVSSALSVCLIVYSLVCMLVELSGSSLTNVFVKTILYMCDSLVYCLV
ncbi:hypothetical protein HanOQP8_Chr14g0522001 [Helianthus annuus]|nr:hypothetical protein HanHA89_Chr14g0561361 [Helianthus annuus]KAJ0655393.1 hypothetical protein HanLR1_Chr14g0523681 [Helianthus annuus]KAJ0659085.1 hypothetical protein HanOQP8_Chr14g0522001 [Helianthus annuus]